MLSFLKFRKKLKLSRGNKTQCENSQDSVICANSPPPNRHHSTHANRHLSTYQENVEDSLDMDNSKANSGNTGKRSTNPISVGLLAAKLEMDEWGLQIRARGIHKKAPNHANHSSSNPIHAKVHPTRKILPRKFLSMAQYNKLADEMKGHQSSRYYHNHHPSHKGSQENYKSRSMKERREFREMNNNFGFNSHKKSGKVTFSTLYRIDEEDGENDGLHALEIQMDI